MKRIGRGDPPKPAPPTAVAVELDLPAAAIQALERRMARHPEFVGTAIRNGRVLMGLRPGTPKERAEELREAAHRPAETEGDVNG